MRTASVATVTAMIAMQSMRTAAFLPTAALRRAPALSSTNRRAVSSSALRRTVVGMSMPPPPGKPHLGRPAPHTYSSDELDCNH
eukprot:8413-Heterococcus_DN1.PRE.4